ncbi:sigma factor-like helix-turn-helix DNA-binding protein [Saccharopolyspora dendranthemae]|uniref:Sigma-70-like protein n=1 Tax=Saccharopolyspora dendranthemae TaxID=1181886 RepID=A0A561TX19_9PSEU|nr:sigma factor-like helix-turn-helix DNA-binding protein [Saccharopolyspora dendranthemae]TWF91649.1 sigma-70-like protein [Saccharopolyspora dendranthemae]
MGIDHEIRESQIKEARIEGATLEEIGRIHGITRERVRQILKSSGNEVSSEEAKKKRYTSRSKALNESIAEFLDEYRDVIADLANDGALRSDVEERFQILAPNIPYEVVRQAVESSAELFDHRNTQEYRFPDSVVESAVWYTLGRSLKLDPIRQSAVRDINLEEAREVSNTLAEEGFSADRIAEILATVISTREHHRNNPDVALTSKCYTNCRDEILKEFGNESRKGAWPWPPTNQTVMKRLGGGYWADAMRRVGISPGDKGRQRGQIIFQVEDYYNSVSGFLKHASEDNLDTTFTGYKKWVIAEERAGRRRPSSDAVRKQFNSWTNAKRAVASSVKADLRSVKRTGSARFNPGGKDALNRSQVELTRFMRQVKTLPTTEASDACLKFISEFCQEFEVSRRNWLRAMIYADCPDSISRQLSARDEGIKLKLTNKQIHELRKPEPDLDTILSSNYLDGLLNQADPRNTDGWLRKSAQDELDAISVEDLKRFRILRYMRNAFVHKSPDARLERAISDLSDDDPGFELKQSATLRVVGDWLRSRNFSRFDKLCQSVPNIWRAMVVSEIRLSDELAG